MLLEEEEKVGADSDDDDELVNDKGQIPRSLLESLQKEMEMLVFDPVQRQTLENKYLLPLEGAMAGTPPKRLELGWESA